MSPIILFSLVSVFLDLGFLFLIHLCIFRFGFHFSFNFCNVFVFLSCRNLLYRHYRLHQCCCSRVVWNPLIHLCNVEHSIAIPRRNFGKILKKIDSKIRGTQTWNITIRVGSIMPMAMEASAIGLSFTIRISHKD